MAVGVSFKLDLRGADQVIAELRRLGAAYPKAAALGIFEEQVEIMKESQRRAPTDDGDLKRSAYVTHPDGSANPLVQSGYGALYAPVQHERSDYHHERGGEAKFLQKAIDARASVALANIARVTQANIAKPGIASSAFPTEPQNNSSPKGRKGEVHSKDRTLGRRIRNVRIRRR